MSIFSTLGLNVLQNDIFNDDTKPKRERERERERDREREREREN